MSGWLCEFSCWRIPLYSGYAFARGCRRSDFLSWFHTCGEEWKPLSDGDWCSVLCPVICYFRKILENEGFHLWFSWTKDRFLHRLASQKELLNYSATGKKQVIATLADHFKPPTLVFCLHIKQLREDIFRLFQFSVIITHSLTSLAHWSTVCFLFDPKGEYPPPQTVPLLEMKLCGINYFAVWLMNHTGFLSCELQSYLTWLSNTFQLHLFTLNSAGIFHQRKSSTGAQQLFFLFF